MPGHVKKGGKQEQDPDPSPWLVLSFEMKKEDSLKPYGRVIGFLNCVIHLSFQMQRNLSGSLMVREVLMRL